MWSAPITVKGVDDQLGECELEIQSSRGGIIRKAEVERAW